MLLTVLEWLALRRKRPGAHGIWTAAALAAFLLRRHHRQVRQEAVTLREELRPGETLVITHSDTPSG
jgi:hypothetical protein